MATCLGDVPSTELDESDACDEYIRLDGVYVPWIRFSSSCCNENRMAVGVFTLEVSTGVLVTEFKIGFPFESIDIRRVVTEAGAEAEVVSVSTFF